MKRPLDRETEELIEKLEAEAVELEALARVAESFDEFAAADDLWMDARGRRLTAQELERAS